MLPVLLEELKSASLPAKQQGGRESRMKEGNLRTRWSLPCLTRPPAPCTLWLSKWQDSRVSRLSALSSKQTREGARRTSFHKPSLDAQPGWFHKDRSSSRQSTVTRGGQNGMPLPVRRRSSLDNRSAKAQTSGRRQSRLVCPKVLFPGECIFGLLQLASHTWIWHVRVWRESASEKQLGREPGLQKTAWTGTIWWVTLTAAAVFLVRTQPSWIARIEHFQTEWRKFTATVMETADYTDTWNFSWGRGREIIVH